MNKNLNTHIDNLLSDIELPTDEELKRETTSKKLSISGKNAVITGQLKSVAHLGGKAVVDKLNKKNKESNHWRKLGDSKIGVARTEETKEKIQKASAHSWRTILQFTKDGKFIREWKNLASIKEELGFHHTNICACCQNKPKYKTSYGFIWKYKDEKDLDISN